MPLGALFVAFFAIAIPAILLMSVWAGVAAFRLLFPEEELPFTRARQRGTGDPLEAPVRFRDILEDQEARRAVAAREGHPEDSAGHPLFDDLWLRRN